MEFILCLQITGLKYHYIKIVFDCCLLTRVVDFCYARAATSCAYIWASRNVRCVGSFLHSGEVEDERHQFVRKTLDSYPILASVYSTFVLPQLRHVFASIEARIIGPKY